MIGGMIGILAAAEGEATRMKLIRRLKMARHPKVKHLQESPTTGPGMIDDTPVRKKLYRIAICRFSIFYLMSA